MATIHIDIIDGHRGKYDVNGWSGLTRMAIVRDLTDSGGSGSMNIFDALDALIVVVGNIGDAHPDRAVMKIQSFTPTAITDDHIKFAIEYADEDPSDDPNYADIEVGASTTQVETNKDVDGNLITLAYTYPSDYKPDRNLQDNLVQQGGMVSRMVPQTTLVYSRKESSSPGSNARDFVGTVNEAGWTLVDGGVGVEARTWLCTSITGRSADSGETWSVTYTFEYRADTWDQEVVFIDPNTGKPPPDLDDSGQGDAQKTVQVYEEKDFDDLGL